MKAMPIVRANRKMELFPLREGLPGIERVGEEGMAKHLHPHPMLFIPVIWKSFKAIVFTWVPRKSPSLFFCCFSKKYLDLLKKKIPSFLKWCFSDMIFRFNGWSNFNLRLISSLFKVIITHTNPSAPEANACCSNYVLSKSHFHIISEITCFSGWRTR